MKDKKTSLEDSFLNFSLKDPNKLSNGWKITPLSADRSAKHMEYVKRGVEAQKERDKGREKLPVSTIQSASTQRLLTMTDEELVEYRNRKIDVEKAQVWKNSDEAKSALDKAAERNKSKDGLIAQRLREAPKNQQGDAMSEGLSGSSHRKEDAVAAYLNEQAKLSRFEKAMISTADPEVFKGKIEEIKEPGFLSRIAIRLGKMMPKPGSDNDDWAWRPRLEQKDKK